MVFNAPVIIFQLYRGGKFYWKTSENPKKTTNLSQLSHWQALPRNLDLSMDSHKCQPYRLRHFHSEYYVECILWKMYDINKIIYTEERRYKENPKKTTNLSQLSHWQALPRNVVHLILIDTDSIGSCKSNYHAIKKVLLTLKENTIK
jgi:hypothetical protein